MAQVIIRNLDDDVVATLKKLAEAENTSLEQKLRDELTRIARRNSEEFWEVAAAIRQMTRGSKLNPTDVIRKARDER